MTTAFASPIHGFTRPEGQWTPFAGDPSQLVGDSPLIREANSLYEQWQKRRHYLAEAEQAPEDARLGVIALHDAYLAEIDRAVAASEPSTLAAELERKRDDADRDARTRSFEDTINAAERQVEIAASRYADLIADNWETLLGAIEPDAAKVAADYAKAHDELERRLAPIRERWSTLWEQSRKVVGGVADFCRDDLPDHGEYTRPPLPSVESIQRVTAPPAPPVEPATA